MKLRVNMPWESDLSVNASHFGPGGHYRRKPNVQAWMRVLAWHYVNPQAGAAGLEFKLRVLPNGEMKADLLNPEYLCLPIRVVVDFRYPDNRRRDDHNLYKNLVDAVADGLGIDDKDIRVSTGSVVVDKKHPRFTITVTDEEEG